MTTHPAGPHTQRQRPTDSSQIYPTHQQVKDLEEAAAFARGADFLSEAFVFSVGGAWPYN